VNHKTREVADQTQRAGREHQVHPRVQHMLNMLEDNSRSNPNLDMSMPAGGGLPLRIAMFVPLEGSTAAYARVARRTAGRFKGRNSCLALEGSL